jgi:hypothetical protein
LPLQYESALAAATPRPLTICLHSSTLFSDTCASSQVRTSAQIAQPHHPAVKSATKRAGGTVAWLLGSLSVEPAIANRAVSRVTLVSRAFLSLPTSEAFARRSRDRANFLFSLSRARSLARSFGALNSEQPVELQSMYNGPIVVRMGILLRGPGRKHQASNVLKLASFLVFPIGKSPLCCIGPPTDT